ncbi:MAG: GAF domain-containing protein [Micrococcales bacterium]|uniref:sensor histidine kinase n=1 Tax=Phycicoccus sp. TaxID=1902410 RepID=UPI00199EF09B|nr:ATP-binding protein [Phycicoccus sp.]MBD3782032.1 GAF domain-containing protein [Micrococcales bacterium]HMM94693.1 ATP-binding protein [Phycicoccus sp.]
MSAPAAWAGNVAATGVALAAMAVAAVLVATGAALLVRHRTAAGLAALAAARDEHATATAEVERLHALAVEVVRSVHGATNLATALRGVCARVGQTLDVDRVALLTLGDDRELRKWEQWHRPELSSMPPPPAELVALVAPVAHELLLGARVAVPDVLAPGHRQDALTGELRRLSGEARALLVLPVGVTERGLGLLVCLTTDRPRPWSAAEVRAVEEVSAFVAQAVVNQRLLEVQELQVRELRALDEYKDEFLATVSHELRTPLTSIGGYLEILRDGDLGEVLPAQERALDVIERNAERLRGLIEDLLVLGRMESAGPQAAREPVDLADVAATAVELFGPSAAHADVHLVLEVPERGLVVEGDAAQLERAVLNVLGNAVKFTPAGGRVTLRARSDGRSVRVEVEDTGIGISAGDLARLSERFFRGATATAAEIPGSGLGLSIVRGLVEAHGGVVDIGSAEGYGTTVGLVLPVALEVPGATADAGADAPAEPAPPPDRPVPARGNALPTGAV